MKISILLVTFLLLIQASCEDEDDEISGQNKATWITDAFVALHSQKYPRIKAISWWHENFDKSLLRIDSSPDALDAYKKGVRDTGFLTTLHFESMKLVAPKQGIYHAAYPDFGGTEDLVSSRRIIEFEQLVEKKISWAYFSNNWDSDIQFPKESVNAIKKTGKTPFIRLMPRTDFEGRLPDPTYTMQRIIEGTFDTNLKQWAIEAAQTASPLLVEFGTEINGNWFPWNGQYNGGATIDEYGDPNTPDGPERFKEAYKHIIDICRANGANNITWFFHVNAYGEPEEDWNNVPHYYPGDDYIDWIGVSIYGPQVHGEVYQAFSEIMDDIYPTLAGLSDKPIAILEFAVTEMQ